MDNIKFQAEVNSVSLKEMTIKRLSFFVGQVISYLFDGEVRKAQTIVVPLGQAMAALRAALPIKLGMYTRMIDEKFIPDLFRGRFEFVGVLDEDMLYHNFEVKVIKLDKEVVEAIPVALQLSVSTSDELVKDATKEAEAYINNMQAASVEELSPRQIAARKAAATRARNKATAATAAAVKA